MERFWTQLVLAVIHYVLLVIHYVWLVVHHVLSVVHDLLVMGRSPPSCVCSLHSTAVICWLLNCDLEPSTCGTPSDGADADADATVIISVVKVRHSQRYGPLLQKGDLTVQCQMSLTKRKRNTNKTPHRATCKEKTNEKKSKKQRREVI